MKRTRKLAVLFSIVALCFLIGIGYYILSEQTFYTDVVAKNVHEAVSKAGAYTITWESVRGNPITGVYFSNAFVFHEETQLASIGEVALRLVTSSLVSSSPRVASISLAQLHLDYETVASRITLPQTNSGGQAPFERLYVEDSTINTPEGQFYVEEGALYLNGGDYGIDIAANYLDKKITLAATTKSDGLTTRVRDFNATLGKMKITAEGTVLPSIDLKSEIKNLDIDEIAEIIPAVKTSTLSGVYNASLRIVNKDISNFEEMGAAGVLSSEGGKIWKIPFEDLSAQIYYSGGDIRLRNITSEVFSGQIFGASDVKITPGGAPLVVLQLDARSVRTNAMLDEFPWLENFSGAIESASCDLAGPVNAISGYARLNANSLKVADFTCSDLKASLEIKKGTNIKLNFLGNSLASPMVGKGDIAISPDISINVDVTLPQVAFETLGGQFPQIKQWNAKGSGAASLHIGGAASNLQYSISIDAPSMNVMDEFALNDVTAEFSYSNEGITVKSASARWNEATLTAEGNTKARGGIQGIAFNGNVSNLDISHLSKWNPNIKDSGIRGVIAGTWALYGDSKRPAVSVDIRAPRLSVSKNIVLTDVRTAAAYSAPEITLSKMTFNIASSPISAAGSISLETKDRPLEYNIKGSFKDIDPKSLSSIIPISGDISGKLSGDARVWKSGASAPSYRVFFKESSLRYANELEAKSLNGTITYSGGNLHFDRLRSNLSMGNVNLSGSVGNILNWQRPSSVPIDIATSFTSADIGRISRIFDPLSNNIQGLANGNAKIKGNAGSPVFTASADLRAVRAFGLFLPAVQLRDIKGNPEKIDLPDIKAIVGRGLITANARLEKNENWMGDITAEGRSVDIRSLTYSLDRDTRREITGSLDFNFAGQGPFDSFKGKGHAHIPDLSVMGLKLEDADAGFSVSEGFVIVEDSSAKTYGGDIVVQVVKDLNLTDWGGRVVVKSADMASAFRDIFPDSEGSITGTASFTMRFSGDSRRTSMKDGDGELEIVDGEVLGFDGAESVSKLLGGKPLRFHSAHVTFSLDGKTIYIIPGSRVSAPKGDTAYKYVMIDGNVTTDQSINLSCIGNVNIRALNSFVAGIQGVLSTAFENGKTRTSEELLQNFLGSAITGFTKNEFRDVSLKVSGEPGNILFSDVSIASPVKADTMPAILSESSGTRGKEDERIQIKVEFPVGPGGSSPSESVGGQVGGQLIDQVLKGLIFD